MAARAFFETLFSDIRYALRGFVRNPGYALGAICALALGVGAATAVFSVVDRILFRSLPYRDDSRLVSVGITAPILDQEFVLGTNYLDWRHRETPFEGTGSWTEVSDCDLTEANPVRLRCAMVESTFLPTLGVRPFLGRNFTHAEDLPHAPHVALISYGLWSSRFGGDAEVLRRAIPLDGTPAAVIGVLPPGFEFPTLEHVDVVVPQYLNEAQQRPPNPGRPLRVIARLKPGISIGQAHAALEPWFQDVLRSAPAPFRREIRLTLRSVRDRQIQDARLASWVLLGAVISVLLIACANVANLLLARGARRNRELALRAALGAGRGRLVRQVLAESLVMAAAGGVAGTALAAALVRLFVSIAPAGIPRLEDAGLDLRVLSFTLLVSAACGLLFGLAPALAIPRAGALAERNSTGPRRGWLRQGLVAGQVAACLVLLTSANLLLAGFRHLEAVRLGIDIDHAIAADISLGVHNYARTSDVLSFFERLETRVAGLPGISAAAVCDSYPPGTPLRSRAFYQFRPEGRPAWSRGTGGVIVWRSVTPGYFAALGIPIVRGRAFTEQDRGPKSAAMILSQSLARRFFGGQDPVGRHVSASGFPDYTVVGVAADVKNAGLAGRDDPEYYVARVHSPEDVIYRYPDSTRRASLVVRGSLDPAALAKLVRGEVAALDPTLPVTVQSLPERVRRFTDRPRFNAVLLEAFAAFGLLLAGFGLYAVMAFLVAQRTREIGVRMALGATPSGISRLVAGEAARWVGAGAALGTLGSFAAVRLLGSLLFGTRPEPLPAFTAAAAILWLVALAAAWAPARRAARIDPMESLRHE